MEFSLDRFYQLNQKAIIWAVFFGLAWLLRDFFGLIFTIFIISFLAARITAVVTKYLHIPSWMAITAVHLLFLFAIAIFVRYATPKISHEAELLIGRLGQIETTIIEYKGKLAEKHPGINKALTDYLRGNISEEEAREEQERKALAAQQQQNCDQAPPSLDQTQMPSGKKIELSDEALIKLSLQRQLSAIRDKAPEYFKLLWQGSLTLLLALLFSFLIALDAVRIGKTISNLSQSRVKDFYAQTTKPLVRFGYVVGRAFQAQFMIAILNTVLTVIGMTVLGIPSIAFLALIVFLCSFIPVLGVFISTTPMALVALNAGGVSSAVGVMIMVTIIHIIEAYVLNPIIYGNHMKLNPVLVLIILYIGHHSFGVWGMVLGVPVAYYLLHDVLGVPLWDSLDKKKKETAGGGESAAP